MMLAAVVEKLREPLVVRTIPNPECPPDFAIIRVAANAICRTDWHLWTDDWAFRGLAIDPPFVLGHEFAGVVEEVGSEVRDWKRGDHVVHPMNPGCGTCGECRAGHEDVCEYGHLLMPGVSFWGAFAEFAAVRHADVNLVRVPEQLSLLDAASLGCRYVAAFRAMVEQAKVRPGEWVAVHGCGGMGLSAVQIAASLGVRVIAIDSSQAALLACGQTGAEYLVDSQGVIPIEAIKILSGGGVHVSIDALGIAETCFNSVMCLRRRGRHVQIGHMTTVEAGNVALPIHVILFNELELNGAFGLPAHRYGDVLGLCAEGKLEPGKLVKQVVGLDGITAVLEAMGGYKAVGYAAIKFDVE